MVRPPPEESLHIARTVGLRGLHDFEVAGGEGVALWEKAMVHVFSCGVNEPLSLRAETLEKTHGELWYIVGDNRAGSVFERSEPPRRELGPV